MSAAVLWFASTHGIGVTLKTLINDCNCNVHANSVSGHFAFFTFYMLAHPLLAAYLPRPHTSSYSGWIWLFVPAYIIFFVGASITLSNTYLGGYHSLRQVIYGSMFSAAAFHLFCLLLANAFENHRMMRKLTFSSHAIDAFAKLVTLWLQLGVAVPWLLKETPPFSPLGILALVATFA